jgi:hypothetical protein
MRWILSSILGSACMLPGAVGAEDALPSGCDFGVSASEDVTMSCYEDLDQNGDGSLSREEVDRLPRTRGHFEELDHDGSGGISPMEFQNGMRTLLQRYGGKGV